jgi:integrase
LRVQGASTAAALPPSARRTDAGVRADAGEGAGLLFWRLPAAAPLKDISLFLLDAGLRVGEALNLLWRDTDQFVFSNGSGEPYDNTNLAHMHAAVRDKLGWPSMVLHSLRHSFGTRLKEAGADVFDIMKIIGHSTPQISARYVKTSPERVGSVFARLNEANSGTGPQLAHGVKEPEGSST